MKIHQRGMIEDQRKKFVCGAVEGFYGRPWTSEQRKLLFKWLKKMGLNTYMYAPKDDVKHRAFWRELYSVEEAENMTTLIEAAKESNVEFIYALSPGLDITFSSSKDVQCLKRKLEQVATFGCTAFALLFDDIDPELSEADRSVFHSFGTAQVSVSNEVFEHLGPAHFYFCPTEYCSSRAVPDIASSEYLNTIGAKLLPDVEILWTGSKVITKKITVQHLLQISATLRRAPLIWDNIHANDYDPRRLFLGPYDGRSPEIIPYLRGVLTNPNCEFESNYIALHTLGQWSKSNLDGLKKDIVDSERLSPVVSDIKLETESDFGSSEDIPSRLDTRYRPRHALQVAISDWIAETTSNRLPPAILTPNNSPSSIPISPPPIQLQSLDQDGCVPNPAETRHREMESAIVEENSSYMQPTMNPVNSLVSSPIPVPVALTKQGSVCSPCSSTDSLSPCVEPMDIVSNQDSSATQIPKVPSSDNLMQIELSSNDNCDNMGNNKHSSLTHPPLSSICDTTLGCDDLALLCDLFYLPFEHGSRGEQLLQQLHWIKCNAHLAHSKSHKTQQTTVALDWMEKADNFVDNVKKVREMTRRLYEIPNCSLAFSMFPYIWDILGVLETCGAYVAWMMSADVPCTSTCHQNRSSFTWCSKSYQDAFSNGEQEPWIFRGGLQGELERLLPVNNAQDLYFLRSPEVIIRNLYRYRPYTPADEAAVYNICLKTCDDGMDGSEVFPEYPELIGDRILGAITTLSPEYCFVVEDDEGICGYAVAALDVQQLRQKSAVSWLPAMKEKYPQNCTKDQPSPADEVIMHFHNDERPVPKAVVDQYLSVARIDFIPQRVVDYSVPKRLLLCAMNALKTNKSKGVHVEMNVGDKCMIDHYQRLGFFPVMVTDEQCDEVVYLGRAI